MQFIDIPLAAWVDAVVDWLLTHFQPVFRGISSIIAVILGFVESVFLTVPGPVIVLAISLFAWKFAGRNTAIFTALSLFLIGSLGMWEDAMRTIALVLTATFFSVLIGIPTGILAARNNSVDATIRPILDMMQTMPSFVYLIPALMFFGIGQVPGAIATVIFAMPPSIRLTNLGIRQVPEDVVEAARAFGARPMQMLTKVQLPLAMPTIMAGINQTVLLSVSMVVIAAMIGAGGLGSVIVRALSRVQIGTGFEGGLAIVLVAVILDRISQSFTRSRQEE